MFVEDMALKVFDILFGKTPAVHRLDLVLHDIAVLLDVVLLVEFLTEGHDILAGDIGIGIELGAGSRVRGLDVVTDEVAFLAQVHSGIEFLNIRDRHLLVNGHQ